MRCEARRGSVCAKLRHLLFRISCITDLGLAASAIAIAACTAVAAATATSASVGITSNPVAPTTTSVAVATSAVAAAATSTVAAAATSATEIAARRAWLAATPAPAPVVVRDSASDASDRLVVGLVLQR